MRRLTRRTLLASLGVGAASVAGRTGTTPTSRDAPDATTPTTTTTTADQPPHTTRERFRDASCPSFTDADRTVCWHSQGDTGVYLQPSTAVFRPVSGNDAVETITFTLHNESDRSFMLNPYAWRVERRTDGGWEHVAPDAVAEPLFELPAGETYQ